MIIWYDMHDIVNLFKQYKIGDYVSEAYYTYDY